MEYIAVLNNYLEYSLDDNHTVNLSFQSISIVHIGKDMICTWFSF